MGKMSRRPSAVDLEIGRRISQRRRNIGMRQQDLAHLIDVSIQLVRKYESGRIRIGSSRLNAISLALGVPTGSFFDGNEGVLVEASTENHAELLAFLRTPDGLALNRAFGRITCTVVRRALLGLIDDLIDADSSHQS